MKKYFLIVVLQSYIFTYAQAPEPKLKKTIRGEFQLPRALSNRAFTQVFSGVFNSGISFNLGFQKKYNAGIYYCFTQYQIFPRYFDQPHTIQSNHTAGIKLTYDLLSEKGIFSPHITGGYNFIQYSRIKCKQQEPAEKEYFTFNLGGGLTYNFLIDDEWTGAGFTIGYNFLNHTFNPDAVCLNEWYTFDDSAKQGFQQNIYFGFSLYFDLAKQPTTSE
jgi:hypothetical protein